MFLFRIVSFAGCMVSRTLEEAEDGRSRSRPAWSTPTFKTRPVWVDKMTEQVKSLPHKLTTEYAALQRNT